MLIILAWHQIHNSPHAISPKKFKEQLLFLKKNFEIIEEVNQSHKDLSILLTFDDATIDFYTHAFPILQELDLPATLAVPTNWILNSATYSVQQRINLLKSANPFQNKEAFCDVEELKILLNSELINLAAHGHDHLNLKKNPRAEEIWKPKGFFKDHLNYEPDTFIFPYGATHKSLLPLLEKEYKYLMRIGTASNILPLPTYYYRIIMDQVPSLESLFTKRSLLKFICKECFNRLRKH